jgi:DNA-binding response OmpR family regulator
MTPSSILVVEDDRPLAAMIADYLQQQGFTVTVEGSGDRAVPRILADAPDLVVLDWMLPGLDGPTVCRAVRDAYPGAILMLTARGGEADEVMGLDVGADDYLAKPVRPRVLLARIHALLRRPRAPTTVARAPLRLGELTIDATLREVRVRDEPIELTSGEFDLLLLLASHAGQVVSRRTMYQKLRGAEQDDFDRSIDLRISRLRHKLHRVPGYPDPIRSVRGVGYLYAAP